jgi:hypothetical protein
MLDLLDRGRVDSAMPGFDQAIDPEQHQPDRDKPVERMRKPVQRLLQPRVSGRMTVRVSGAPELEAGD